MRRCGYTLINLFVVLEYVLLACPARAQDKCGEPQQRVFSAEDSAVRCPTAIPDKVLQLLGEDKTVQSIMTNEQVPREKLPASWFLASRLHLGTSTHNGAAFLVVGQPPVSGGSLAMFWIFRSSGAGYDVVLTASAHALAIRNDSCNGYKNIQLSGMSATEFSKSIWRFDGQRYVRWKSSSEPIR